MLGNRSFVRRVIVVVCLKKTNQLSVVYQTPQNPVVYLSNHVPCKQFKFLYICQLLFIWMDWLHLHWVCLEFLSVYSYDYSTNVPLFIFRYYLYLLPLLFYFNNRTLLFIILFLPHQSNSERKAEPLSILAAFYTGFYWKFQYIQTNSPNIINCL